MSAAQLDANTLERLEAARGPLILALSGGGDSTALLHLLAERFESSRVRAVVVDHALREGSRADAEKAASFAETLRISAEIITIDWRESGPPASRRHSSVQAPRFDNPGSSPGEAPLSVRTSPTMRPPEPVEGRRTPRSQQAARQARYRALCAAARAHGAELILTAHTADDQAETVFMRAASGSGWRGLAGMAALAPAPVWPEGRGLKLVRPLLNQRRADLRALLEARDAPWIEDPANANPAFARVRARARLAELEAEGLEPLRLAAIAAKLRPLVERLDADAFALIEHAARFEGEAIYLARTALAQTEAARRALSVLIAAAAGVEREPEADAVARLAARTAQPDFRGAALGGARIARDGATLRFDRDPGAVLGRADGAPGLAALDLPTGVATVWDGRLVVTPREQGWRVEVGADGAELRRGETIVPLGRAASCDALGAHWLPAAHVAHRLSAKFTLTPSVSAP